MSDLAFTQSKPEKVIRLKAMDLLARREHSRLELYLKLALRFPDEKDLLDGVLSQLQQDNLQSDFRFTEAFVNSRINKGQGPQRIAAELQQRGVASSLVDNAIASSGADWYGLAADVLKKKYHSIESGSYDDRAKRSRFLQYRGFSTEQIRTVLD